MGVRRNKAAIGLIVTTVIGVTSAMSSLVATAAPSAAPRTSPSGWSQLSTGKISNIESIGLARFGSDLQVAWVEQAGAKENLVTRIAASNGSAASAPVKVQSSWSTLNEYPVVLPNGGGRLIAFSGVQTDVTSNPYSSGAEYYATSADGKSWTLSTGALSSTWQAYGSYGTDGVDAGGAPIIGYTAGSDSAITYHQGFLTSIPSTSGQDPTTPPAAHCCTYRTGLGYDATAQTTWAVWFSNSGDTATNGVLAQQIEPALGAQSQAPGSNTASNDATDPGQRISTAARVGGGVFAAYSVGYPSPHKVALWRLGSADTLTRDTGGDIRLAGTAAGPDGRVWVYWWNSGSKTVKFARTNPDASKLGATCSAKTPASASQLWSLVGNASQGPLQLVALAGDSSPHIYDAVVKPCLSVSLSRSSISAAKGGSLTVTVSDAGSPIHGAKVSFGGHSKATNVAGKASFSVAKHHAAGRPGITVSDSGYQQATTSIRIN